MTYAPAFPSDGYQAMCIVEDLSVMRDRIDRATDLMLESLDIRERLTWGLDLHDMVAEVAAFKQACEKYREHQQ